ncbi:MAG: inositol monophosphatase [Bryobacteraceae bacterium]|nr:inositol monophosphatase [Solibacteraceae bacterium]MCO5353116.1 inositol monophosphatase [Bryobacteraceae bacterium]HAX43796.1 inositol monophosphatase [Bryobacterales bacterium]HRJ18154.1 inositol monophosphatase family protein [Bryobacteraceae bacterium]
MAHYLETATDIAREAGSLLAHFYERRIGFELKGDFDLVTEADRQSEALVVERLKSHFPSHAVLGEEGGLREAGTEYRWYVDPLDGTTNFAHGFPMFNVTLGLERKGEMICGVVFDPVRQEMFAAERGGGAFLNGRRIQVSKAGRIEEALLATGFPSRKRHENINVHFFHQAAMQTHGVRRAGAAALDLAYVSCGRLDGFWEFGLNPWDMAAGLLLVEEAGGRVSDMTGGAASLTGEHVAASNGAIHEGLLGLFGEVFAGRYRYPMPPVIPVAG